MKMGGEGYWRKEEIGSKGERQKGGGDTDKIRGIRKRTRK